MKITDVKQIKGASFYQKADRDSFLMSFQILKRNNFGTPKSQKILKEVLPNFHKALWVPDGKDLLGIGKRSNKVSGYELTHQCVHFLIAQRYGGNLQGMPRLTALSEGIAGASDLYFNFMYLKNGGPVKNVNTLHLYRQSAAILDTRMTRRLKKVMADPFQAFQKTALTSLDATMTVLDAFQSAKQNGHFDYAELAKKLKAFDNYVFVMHKDITNFVLFIGAHCGYKSSKKDLASCKDLKNILLTSDSYSDFLRALSS